MSEQLILRSPLFHPEAAQLAVGLLRAIRAEALPVPHVTLGIDCGVCFQWTDQRTYLTCWGDMVLLETPLTSWECDVASETPDYTPILAQIAAHV